VAPLRAPESNAQGLGKEGGMHEHGYDPETGTALSCPMSGCWWNEEITG
jgi:hypothetical protein